MLEKMVPSNIQGAQPSAQPELPDEEAPKMSPKARPKASANTIEVRNNCGTRIFVKNAAANSGNFNLENGQSRRFTLKGDASARVWAHKGCDQNGRNCDTTEGYVSLAEMHWDDTRGMVGYTWYVLVSTKF